MDNLHHKTIKKFSLDGDIYDDSAIWRLKNEYIRLLTMEMRLSGYVPRLDMDPDFTVNFVEEKEYFTFRLSIYGVYVGKKKSECILGIDEQRVIYTQTNKSNVSSSEAESQLNQK